MRIGILTFTAADNYGAVLQAYALSHFLQSRDREVVCLDYRPRYLTNKKSFRIILHEVRQYGWKSIKSYIRTLLYHYQIKHRKNIFENFRSRFLPLVPFAEYEKQDMIIIGSDQVWNTKITDGDAYFLGKFPDYKGIVASYAASMESVSEKNIDAIKSNIHHFDNISVREYSLQKVLHEQCNRASELVVDPTFLLSSKEWENIEEPYKVAKPYMLAFVFGLTNAKKKQLDDLAKSKGLNLVVVLGRTTFFGQTADDCSPNQLIYLVHHAEVVVTNSFHGLAFATIFKKRTCVIGKSTNERVINLLQMIDRKEALITSETEITSSCFYQLSVQPDAMQSVLSVSKQFLTTIS